jgi:hypothetical protein
MEYKQTVYRGMEIDVITDGNTKKNRGRGANPVIYPWTFFRRRQLYVLLFNARRVKGCIKEMDRRWIEAGRLIKYCRKTTGRDTAQYIKVEALPKVIEPYIIGAT